MSGINLNWAAVYGTNNVAAQMMGDISFSQFVGLLEEPLAEQIGQIQAQLQQLNAQTGAWTTLQGDAQTLLNDLNNLSATGTAFQAVTVTSSDPAAVQAAADQSAVQGSYTVEVLQLAQAELDGSASAAITVTSPTVALNLPAGTVSISVGGSTVSIAVSSTASLDSLEQAINQSGAGVKATVEEDASGDYFLQIQALQTDAPITYGGDTNALVSLGIMVSTSSGVTNNAVYQAQPALIQLGTAGSQFASSTDTFTGVIPGLTLTVSQASASAVLTVGPNVSGIAATIQQFVNDWNTFVQDTENLALGTQAGPPTSTTAANGQTTASFAANPNQVIFSPVPMATMNQIESVMLGFYQPGNPYGMLAALGITPSGDQKGTLSVNPGTLENALATNLGAVQQFFAALSAQVTPLLAGYAQGPQSVTGVNLSENDQLTQHLDQEKTQIQEEAAALQTQAAGEYQSWLNALSQLAQEEQLFQALQQGQGSGGNGG
ncbi:Flagellar hook-associated protein fliD [Candidatus Hydrogenisulfobacillus filiaventi]|uniref:Flagellar hook-associated protein 2 n=1 Tax=Candidatus Hydrogenisulfobacillus filiaventi TaxID=2707344 RepID=A0A6F8ZEG4_9FIRM|nr:flagellar filament capping protein FliD [Bacillota bacterium]CAB1128033.1 Flagellar hook-associated protein fliD [Candidatus Hydrogenisulfobacillus filiaventi]